MSDAILFPLVAFCAGLAVGAAAMWRIVMRAFDEYERDLGSELCPKCRRPLREPHHHGVLYLPRPAGPPPPPPPMPPA